MVETETSSTIKRHPTAWFFFFAFLISWMGWFLAPTLSPLGSHVTAFISLIGSYGPAFSAILVSSIANLGLSGASVTKRRATFVVIFVVALLVQLLATYVVGGEISGQTILFGVLGAVIAAYVVSCVYHSRLGVAELMAGLKRVSWRSFWLWAALLLPFVWQFLGSAIDLSLGGDELFSLTPTALFVLVSYYPFIVFFGGGLNEEPGWRGFAVPRMQHMFSPLVAGLIIGVVWSTWHFPLHATGVADGGLASFPFRFIYNVPLGVLFSWLYNRSGGNLFACVVLHASYNSASTIFGGTTALVSLVLMIIFTVFVAVYDGMWRKEAVPQPQTLSPTMTTNSTGKVAFYRANADNKSQNR
jgi:membrane protease YdiL (CAAX protease family)